MSRSVVRLVHGDNLHYVCAIAARLANVPLWVLEIRTYLISGFLKLLFFPFFSCFFSPYLRPLQSPLSL